MHNLFALGWPKQDVGDKEKLLDLKQLTLTTRLLITFIENASSKLMNKYA